MFFEARNAAFVVAATDHGTMILNRLDFSEQDGGGVGVAVQLLQLSHYDVEQLELLCQMMEMRRESHGDGVVCIDGGANIGTYTIALARMMTGWGSVLAFEPQERICYALCGNVAINNCNNAKVFCAGLAQSVGVMPIERVDYNRPRNFGGVKLGRVEGPMDEVQVLSVDSFELERLDLLKIDVEGMELEILEGAQRTLERCKPIVNAEHIYCGEEELRKVLGRFGYRVYVTGMNVTAVHEDDPVGNRIKFYDSKKGERAA